MRVVLSISLIIWFVQFKAQSVEKSKASDEIVVLIHNFQEAISKKDSVLLSKIFFDKNSPVIGVMSDSTEMSIKRNVSEFQGLTVSNSQRFIKEICSSSNQLSEKFANTKIEIDDKIATVRFDYAFFENGEVYQWGQESWSLVYAEEQWLISGINFTIRFPSIEPPPKEMIE